MLPDTGVLTWRSKPSNWPDASSSSNEMPLSPTSRPIFTSDPLAFKSDPASRAVSFVIHCVIVAVILWLTLRVHTSMMQSPNTNVTPLNFTLYAPPPPVIVPVAKAMGGGGGAHQVVEAVKGKPPVVVMKMPVLSPQILQIDHPKLGVEPSEPVKIPVSSNMPKLGISQSPQISLASQGRGSSSGFGQGFGGGIGSVHGSGAGYGGGLMSVGDGVTAPKVIHSVEPDFTEEARQANFQGSVSIKLIVDSQGNPQDVQLVRHLGMGLDEKAIEAVKQYKFKPAMYQGRPVSVQIVIDVDFHLH